MILVSLFLSSPISTCHSLSQIQYLPIASADAASDSLSEADTLSDEITLYAAVPKSNETGIGDRLVKDEDGYFYSTDQLNPPWQLVPKNYSMWDLAKNIISLQGIESLWSALGSDVLLYYSSTWTEKAIELIIAPHNAWNRIGIALIRSFILAPLDIIQIRLIAQSSHPWYQAYTSTFNALKSLFSRVEVGVLYTSTRVLSSVLETGLSSILYLGIITFIKHYKLGAIGMIGLGFLHAGLMSPLETIRKRIQVSTFPQEEEIKTIVQVPKIPWVGIKRTFYRMWHEEGIGSFYRGFKRKWLITVLGLYDLN